MRMSFKILLEVDSVWRGRGVLWRDHECLFCRGACIVHFMMMLQWQLHQPASFASKDT
ncbi:hypothetical protein BDR04DRAFT_1092663, partial [Suillus decipiens]